MFNQNVPKYSKNEENLRPDNVQSSWNSNFTTITFLTRNYSVCVPKSKLIYNNFTEEPIWRIGKLVGWWSLTSFNEEKLSVFLSECYSQSEQRVKFQCRSEKNVYSSVLEWHMPSCGGKEKAKMQSQVWQTQVYVSQKEQKHKKNKRDCYRFKNVLTLH